MTFAPQLIESGFDADFIQPWQLKSILN